MKASLYATVVVITLTLSANLASADYYAGIGLGAASALDDGTLADSFTAESHFHLVIGSRIGDWALEGSITSLELDEPNLQRDLVVGGVNVKYFVALGDRFEAYGKAGLHDASLETESEAVRDYDGFGYQLGAGLEYGFDVGKTPMRIWLDYTRLECALDGEEAGTRGGPDVFDGTVKLVSAGVSVEF
jgi:hypothetical protein